MNCYIVQDGTQQTAGVADVRQKNQYPALGGHWQRMGEKETHIMFHSFVGICEILWILLVCSAF